MLVGLRDAIWEVEDAMIHAVRKGKLNKCFLWEYLFHFPSERFIHSVVIVRIKETPILKVISQSMRLFIGESDITVSGHEDKRIGEDVIAHYVNIIIVEIYVDVRVSFHEFQQRRFFEGIVVPIAAAVVFQARDPERARFLRNSVPRQSKTQNRNCKRNPNYFHCIESKKAVGEIQDKRESAVGSVLV